VTAAAVDTGRLARFLDEHGLTGDSEPLHLTPLAGGATNQVFRLRRGGDDLVLRMPTSGVPNAAKSILREARVLGALRGTGVPHAALRATCSDPELLGVPFYVMDHVEGWSPASSDTWPEPFCSDAGLRRELVYELVDGAARLSRVDWVAQGLGDLGRPDGFHERQVDRWLAHLAGFQFRPLPGLDDAAAWLRGHRPRSWQPGIMHGDYQFANVMYAHGTPTRLAAIVDWELSTIGDPLLDLAWVLMSADWNAGKYDLTGMPTDDELIARYRQRSGRSAADIDYYLVLARFKMAIILEGGFARSRHDPAHHRAAGFGAISLELAHRAGDMARSLR
jgi:aminoglycoside phosphotransferase (APT) family kinase protein